jgi:hypothetical protein
MNMVPQSLRLHTDLHNQPLTYSVKIYPCDIKRLADKDARHAADNPGRKILPVVT